MKLKKKYKIKDYKKTMNTSLGLPPKQHSFTVISLTPHSMLGWHM